MLVFAREWSDPLTGLVRKLEELTAERRDAKLACIVVLLSLDESIDRKMQKLAEREKFDNVLLGVMEPAGPTKFQLDKKAAVTVIMYRERKIEANHVFADAGLTEREIAGIVENAMRLVPARK